MKNTKSFGSAPPLRVSIQPSLPPLGNVHAVDGVAPSLGDSVDISLPENPSKTRTLKVLRELGLDPDAEQPSTEEKPSTEGGRGQDAA